MTGCSIADFFGLADQLPEVNGGRYWRIAVGDKTFGCLWEIDELAGLTFEAWRLTAPAVLIDRRGDRLPH